MKILFLVSLFLVLLYEIEARKHHHHHHKDKKREKDLQHALRHHSGKHGEHHKKHSHNKEHHKKKTFLFGLRQQVREFQEKINNMLPRCENVEKCPKGTCCWKGKCKMLPHRISQRCSDKCPCNDDKNMLFCHLKKGAQKKTNYGRCYIKGKEIGISRVNFIPEAIEKLKDVEKKLDEDQLKQMKHKKRKRDHKKKKHVSGERKHEGKRSHHAERKHKGKKHGEHKHREKKHGKHHRKNKA